MKIVHLFDFLADAFRCLMHHYECLVVPPGPPSIENGSHDTKKFLLKTQGREDLA